jgi:hypothetical protein
MAESPKVSKKLSSPFACRFFLLQVKGELRLIGSSSDSAIWWTKVSRIWSLELKEYMIFFIMTPFSFLKPTITWEPTMSNLVGFKPESTHPPKLRGHTSTGGWTPM